MRHLLAGMQSYAVCFDIGHTKYDQDGTKHVDHPFYVNSCPEKPVICMFLPPYKCLFGRPRILLVKCKKLIQPLQWHSLWQCTITRALTSCWRWSSPFIFETYSLHKCAVTHVACGVTSSPLIVYICIGANQKMLGIFNCYIKYEGVGTSTLEGIYLDAIDYVRDLYSTLPSLIFHNSIQFQKGDGKASC